MTKASVKAQTYFIKKDGVEVPGKSDCPKLIGSHRARG